MQNIPDIQQKDDDTQPRVKTVLPKPKKEKTTDDTLKSIFWAVILALVIRTFLFEPFNIPSGSMIPSLLVGDFLFVNKYSYGYSDKSVGYGFVNFDGRVWDTKPKRGDVVVFKLPTNPSIDYIKRLIGMPGDTIQVKDGILYINGNPLPREPKGDYKVPLEIEDRTYHSYTETLPGGKQHPILELGDDEALDNTPLYTVPAGHYFMMGDNRDNSQDSRVMPDQHHGQGVGFVPAENLVGRAEIIFFSLSNDTQIWEIWKWPFKIRYDRLLQRIH